MDASQGLSESIFVRSCMNDQKFRVSVPCILYRRKTWAAVPAHSTLDSARVPFWPRALLLRLATPDSAPAPRVPGFSAWRTPVWNEGHAKSNIPQVLIGCWYLTSYSFFVTNIPACRGQTAWNLSRNFSKPKRATMEVGIFRPKQSFFPRRQGCFSSRKPWQGHSCFAK